MIRQLTLLDDKSHKVPKKALKPVSPGTRAMRRYSAKLRKKMLEVLGDKCAICGNLASNPVLHHNDGSGFDDRKAHNQYSIWRKASVASESERKNYSIMCMRCHALYHFTSEDILRSIIKYKHDHPPITRKD